MLIGTTGRALSAWPAYTTVATVKYSYYFSWASAGSSLGINFTIGKRRRTHPAERLQGALTTIHEARANLECVFGQGFIDGLYPTTVQSIVLD